MKSLLLLLAALPSSTVAQSVPSASNHGTDGKQCLDIDAKPITPPSSGADTHDHANHHRLMRALADNDQHDHNAHDHEAT